MGPRDLGEESEPETSILDSLMAAQEEQSREQKEEPRDRSLAGPLFGFHCRSEFNKSD